MNLALPVQAAPTAQVAPGAQAAPTAQAALPVIRFARTPIGSNRPSARPTTGLVHASELGRMSRVRARLDEAVSVILHQIDEQLRAQQSSQTGIQTLEYPMPGYVHVVGLSPEDTLLYVYAKIIASLKAREYVVYLVQEKGAGILYINWTGEIDPTERRAMLALIRNCTRSRDAKGNFTDAPPRLVHRR